MNRHSHMVISLAIVLVAGCTGGTRSLPAPEDDPIDSSISSPTEVISPTQPSSAQGLSSTAAALETAKPLAKAPLISYVVYGGDGEASSELNTCMNWLGPHERFVLYDDGQLLQYKSGRILEARLTPFEIQDLLSRVERTGFHDIEETSEAPDGYDIYNLPDDYQDGDGGWGRSIEIGGRRIHIRDSLWEYTIPSIEDTLKLIETYEPRGGTSPYVPREIEVFALPKDSGYLPEESFESATEWPSELPPLGQAWLLDEADTAALLDTGMYISLPDIRAFIYEGTEYAVVACPSRHQP